MPKKQNTITNYKLSDEAISHIAQTIQIAMLTGTDVVDRVADHARVASDARVGEQGEADDVVTREVDVGCRSAAGVLDLEERHHNVELNKGGRRQGDDGAGIDP